MVLNEADEPPSPELNPEPGDDGIEADPAPELRVDSPADEALAALAEAEAQLAAAEMQFTQDDGTLKYHAVGPRALSERRKLGTVVWGAIALALAINVWLFPLACSRLSAKYASSPLFETLVIGSEVGMLIGAIVFGTLGCRRTAGKKMAFIGRLLAWSTPVLAWALTNCYVLVDALVGLVAVLLWAALGFFIFAIFDTMVAP